MGKKPVNEAMIDKSEIKKCKLLLKKIVKVQGRIFIKELLRTKKVKFPGIRLGVSKEEIVNNLENAIEQGYILYDDLKHWVNEVEGWGRQHVYLFHVNDAAQEPVWESPDNVRGKMGTALLDDAVWENKGDLTFPKKLTLTNLYYEYPRFECVWHQRVSQLIRESSKDPESKFIEGDRYEFRAYRHSPLRSVMRFELYLNLSLAALFIQVPLGNDHNDAYLQATDLLNKFFRFKSLSPVDLSSAILALDSLELDLQADGLLEAHNAKFASQGATVEFAAGRAISGFKQVEAVRNVRRAMDDKAFTGDSAKFKLHLDAGVSKKGELKRDVIMGLNTGKRDRIYLYAQMTRNEVWHVLNFIKNNEKKT